MLDIRTVTVIGVTGTMGANVAGIFASFGNAKVYCVGRDIEKVKATIPRIVKSVRADSIAQNLYPMDMSSLEYCVSKSDLVFESTAEKLDVKLAVAKRVATSLQTKAISCTGTSGLSIHKIAEQYSESMRKNVFGVHMFNPPYNMSLCELISTIYSDEKVKNKLKEYLSAKLFRTVTEVKDSPAFLGNRIGFHFINEALQYAVQYKDSGGIDYIDAILGTFTGRAMPPLLTSDFVGLDVHKAIVNNVFQNTCDYAHDAFALPEFVEQLIKSNKLGRKTGAGLYQTIKYDNGLKRYTVFDIRTGMYRDIKKYVFPFVDSMKYAFTYGDYNKAFEQLVSNSSAEAEICLSFLLKYIVYALFLAQELGDKLECADDVMATGFNWCPPLALYSALSNVVNVNELVHTRVPELAASVDVDRLFGSVGASKYDFRRFFKTGS